MINIIKKRFAEPLTPMDLLLAGLLFSVLLILPYYIFYFWKVTYAMGGWRIPLIKFSWYYLFFIVANGLCLFWFILKNPKPGTLRKSSISIFIVSNVLGAVFIYTNLIHFSLFRENWNLSTMKTAIDGVRGGQAPLGIEPLHLVIVPLVLSIILLLLSLIVKLIPKPKMFYVISARALAIGAFSLLGLLAVGQRSIPSTWYSNELQSFIPWVTFAKPLQRVQVDDTELQSLESLENLKDSVLKKLDYNVRTLSEITAKRKPNILFVHAEGIRSDMFSPTYMPKFYEFADSQGTILKNHYSSGNNTGLAIYSLLTGLYGTYYQNFRAKPGYLAPVEILRQLGYQITVHNSMEDDYENHGELFFTTFNKHMVLEGSVDENDQQLFDETLAQLTKFKAGDQPRFDYLYLNSSHFPFDYPERFEKYTPVLRGMNYDASVRHNMEQNKIALKNTYFNALLFSDELLNNFVEGLIQSAYWQNSIIIITGDHGEEFWEHGRFGHIYGLSREQTKVLSFVHFPEGFETQYKHTAHHDFFPTIFNYMSLNQDIDHWMSGKDLFSYDADRDYNLVRMSALSNQKRFEEAIIKDDLKVVYELNSFLKVKSITNEDDDVFVELEPHEKPAYKLIKKAYFDKKNQMERVLGSHSNEKAADTELPLS